MKAQSHIIVRWSRYHRDAESPHDASVHQFSLNRWTSFLIAIPLALIGVVCAVFFFSAFVALCLVAGSALGIWLWWSRRQVLTDREPGALEGVYRVVDEPPTIEPPVAGVEGARSLRR